MTTMLELAGSRKDLDRLLVADLIRRYNTLKKVDSAYSVADDDKVYHAVPVTNDCCMLVVYPINDFLVQMTKALEVYEIDAVT